MSTRDLQDVGEALVRDLLVRARWDILAENFRCQGSELDLVAAKGSTVIVVEVKTRRSIDALLLPESLLSPSKILAIRRGAQKVLADLGTCPETVRLDLALVCASPKPWLARYLCDAACLERHF